MNPQDYRYLIFDIESVADANLVSQIRYAGKVDPDEAVDRYRAELMEKYDSDFIPYTFQFPVSVAVGKVTKEFILEEIVVLDEPKFRPHLITERFWRGWERYGQPTLVSFNGRGFDIPLLELAAFRYGVSAPGWFMKSARTYDQPRNRYNSHSHLDLCDMLTNYGASRFNGGLNLAANILGKPGKMDVQGDMVQDMYSEGKLLEINNYCRCDVLDTYFVFLRYQVITGNLQLVREQEIIQETYEWLERSAHEFPAYRQYLDNWGQWHNPWEE